MNTSKYNLSRNLLTVLCFIFFTFPPASAQLTVTPNQTAVVLAATLAGPGVTILSPTLTCPTVANGKFTSVGTLLAMSNGIVLTNGKAAACVGPNGAPPGVASNNDGAPGDPALAPFLPAGTPTNDACILEFNIVAAGDSIGFNYQFGSQEYYHSTCGQYPDIFAFFISGPGIVGAPNIALVPGTNIPVEINSVNAGAPGGPGGLGPGVNISNCTSLGAGSPFTAYFINNWGGTQLSYTGYTTKFRAIHAVTPCDTYHLKLTIADADNSIYDSGVFLEAASLTPPTITTPPAICVGGTTTLTPPTTGGTWTSANTTVATIGSSTGIVTGVGGGTATISYLVGPTCAVTTIVTVTALAGISGTPSLCAGGSTTLTDAVTGGAWSSSNTTIATIGSSSGIVNGLAIGTTTISYVTVSGCSTSIVVTVNSVAAITGVTNICVGATTALSDIITGGTWSSSNTSVATVSVFGLETAIAAGTAIITYTTAGGCKATLSVTVGTFSSSTLNANICQGSSYIFGGTTYTTAGTYIHTFITSTCDSIVTLNLTVNSISSTTIYDSICNGISYSFGGAVYATSGTYTFTTTSVSGCDSSVILNLFVKSLPPAPSVISPVTYCLNQQVTQLSATGTGLVWYTAIGGASSTIPITPSDGVAGITKYYVGEIVDGCAGPLDTIQVLVYPSPAAVINAIRTTLCQFDTTSLFAGAVPSGSYLWYAPGTNIISGNTTGQQLVMQFNTLGNHMIYLTVSENGQCSATDSIDIVAIPAPSSTFYVKPNVCLGDTVVVGISSTTAGVTNCIWNFEDATVIASTVQVLGGPYGVTWSTPGIHYIQLSAAIGQCMSAQMTDTIDVHPLPSAQFSDLTSGNICTGDSALLSATIQDPENQYEWSPEHFFKNTNSSEIYGIIERAGYVKLNVTSPFGCKGEDSLMINAHSCCEVLFPNAFTPNGDGKNDIFRPITVGHHSLHVFLIKNRYGQTVFETTDEKEGWNGIFNGVPQDMGVYFYFMKYDCNGKSIDEKGDVTLIR